MKVPHITVIYSDMGEPVSDFQVDDTYARWLKAAGNFSDFTTTTASMLAILRARVGVREGECTLTILYRAVKYEVEPDGELVDWGDIPDFNLNLLLRIVG